MSSSSEDDDNYKSPGWACKRPIAKESQGCLSFSMKSTVNNLPRPKRIFEDLRKQFKKGELVPKIKGKE